MAEKGEQMDVLQGALVLSCASKKAADIIRLVFDVDESVAITKRFDAHSVLCYPVHLDTKYYEADIHLLILPERDLISEQFANVVNAVIIYFESQESSFEQVKRWLPFIDKYSPEVKILVCDKASDDSEVTRDTILKWCIENEFELVELSAVENDDDDFKEITGIQRIKQALNAHTWPSMHLKPNHSYKPSPRFEDALRIEFERDADNIASQIHSLRVNDSLDENSENSFEALFSQFAEMKNKAQQLNGDERRMFAEKVTIAFWKSLGGDDQEIEALDSD